MASDMALRKILPLACVTARQRLAAASAFAMVAHRARGAVAERGERFLALPEGRHAHERINRALWRHAACGCFEALMRVKATLPSGPSTRRLEATFSIFPEPKPTCVTLSASAMHLRAASAMA